MHLHTENYGYFFKIIHLIWYLINVITDYLAMSV